MRANAQGRIDLRGMESIAVFANADENGAPAPGLEAATFAFTSHGDITDGGGGEVLLRFTGGLTPVTLREIGHGAQVLLADLDGGALTLTATADPGELGYITTAEGLAQALGLASAAGDTVTLQGDLTLSKGLSLLLAANQTITLDLNGHALRAGAELLHALLALSGEGTLRLTGGALRGSGEELPLVFVADGTLEVANVTIDNAGGTAARLLLRQPPRPGHRGRRAGDPLRQDRRPRAVRRHRDHGQHRAHADHRRLRRGAGLLRRLWPRPDRSRRGRDAPLLPRAGGRRLHRPHRCAERRLRGGQRAAVDARRHRLLAERRPVCDP